MNNYTHSKKEDDLLEEHVRLTAPNIHQIISAEGDEELNRPVTALVWSAFVAGICISFSVIMEGILQYYLPEEKAFSLISNLGYTAGFLIVILGRFQLFTENTITVILPLLKRFTRFNLIKTVRLWTIVLLFNIVGALFISTIIYYLPVFTDEIVTSMLDVSHHAVVKDNWLIFITAIPAGFLIATLVWMMPNAEYSQFWVIVLITYIIAVCDFAHIIAGSVEAFLLILDNQISIAKGLTYISVAGLGNIIGGTILFSVMAHAQVKKEI